MILALGDWDPITLVLNSLVLELIFFVLVSLDGTDSAMSERMTKDRSAVSRTLPPVLTVGAHPV